ncbi:MAG: DCC1-like thiol-disulfide oxidoreductase family protein [Myxococcota bacterium]|nr:DCC1-like thiol-disulfide oxidoreductase family protein [Myxococcota bacterium]
MRDAVPVLPPRLVLFDGECGLCDASVQWLLEHDPAGHLRFSPLQGQTAAVVRARGGWPEGLDSIVFVEDGCRLSWRSTAAVRIARTLPWPWRLLAAVWLVPRPLRDLAYRMLAALRYRVWGRRDACRLPDDGEAARFLP